MSFSCTARWIIISLWLGLLLSCGASSGDGDESADSKASSDIELSSDTSPSSDTPGNTQEEPPPWSGGADGDGDGITDAMEAVVGTDPKNPDSDEDGVQDGDEFDLGTNPLDEDSDGDGITDGAEVEQGTNPASADTDGDGFGDDEEAVLSTDPVDRFDWSFGGERWPDMRKFADGTYGTGWEAGAIMPDVALTDQWDQALQLSQFYGYVILLDFSAGWCVPCRAAAEIAEGLWITYRDEGFMIVHFLTEGSIQGSPATLQLQQQWADSYGISFPVVREADNLAYRNFTFTDLYPGSIPFLLLLDREMRIDSGYGGNQEAAIAARVEELLAAPAPEIAVPQPGSLGDLAIDICDQDGDGHKNVSCGGSDCYDRDASFSSDSDELCDLFDRNCDGRVHEGAVDSSNLYEDLDGDGYGNPELSIPACAPQWPYVDNSDDCDDSDEKLNPDTVWYADNDGDGYGDPSQTKASCLQPDGYVNNGQDSDDKDDTNLGCWKGVTVGRDHSCGLRMDGSVACWGDNTKTQCDVPQDLVFTEITAGYNHTCGLLEDGTPRCWGANMSNALNAPTTTAFDTIACGLNFCCGLTGDSGDNVACWGENAHGQATPPAGTFVQVSARGGRHACGIDNTGSVICWGNPDGFQGGPSPTAAPTGTFTELSAAHYFNMAIRDDGEVVVWGTNKHGQGTAPANETFVKLRGGTVHSCGLTDSDEIKCWGSDSFGRTDCPDGKYIDMDVDQLHSCAVGVDGLISCWGLSDKGQTTPALCTD